MKIGNWELRKPWVRYVEVELEEQFYNEIRKSIGEDIAKEIDELCTDECQIHPNIYFHNGHNAAAKIARGNK